MVEVMLLFMSSHTKIYGYEPLMSNSSVRQSAMKAPTSLPLLCCWNKCTTIHYCTSVCDFIVADLHPSHSRSIHHFFPFCDLFIMLFFNYCMLSVPLRTKCLSSPTPHSAWLSFCQVTIDKSNRDHNLHI